MSTHAHAHSHARAPRTLPRARSGGDHLQKLELTLPTPSSMVSGDAGALSIARAPPLGPT